MIEKIRVYEIVGTISNKKEREAVGRVLDELYATYESGQTLKATKNKQVRRLVNIYLDERQLPKDHIPALQAFIDWLVNRSGVPAFRKISKDMYDLSAIMDSLGPVAMDSQHSITGKEIIKIRVMINNIFEYLSGWEAFDAQHFGTAIEYPRTWFEQRLTSTISPMMTEISNAVLKKIEFVVCEKPIVED